AGIRLLRVDPLEHFSRNVDLATDFHARGVRPSQLERDRTNGPDVRRDLFAADPVAPRRAANERPVLVGERQAQTVDLQLRDVVDLFGRLTGGREAASHARVELTELLFGVRVVEAEHRFRVLDRVEAGGGT